VCETEIKVRQHGGYTVLAVLLVILGLALVGINKVCLDRLNRLHAIARGDIYSEVMRGEPVRDDETTEMVRAAALRAALPHGAEARHGRSLQHSPSNSTSPRRSSPSRQWCVHPSPRAPRPLVVLTPQHTLGRAGLAFSSTTLR
jgi:hypothetical protein